MANYYSNEVLILDGPFSIESSVSNFSISPNYGVDASFTPVFEITQNTMTGTVTVSNSVSGLAPTIYWTYVKDGQTTTIQNGSPFSFSVVGSSPSPSSSSSVGSSTIYNYDLTISSEADLEEWGNVEVYLNVEPYSNGGFDINTLPSGGLAFETTWGTTPSGVAFSPNLSNEILQGEETILSSVVHSYDSISSAIFEYSDNNKTTWIQVGSEQGLPGATSSSIPMPTGYGVVIGTPPSKTQRSEQLTVGNSQFVEGRYYRIKVTTA